MLKRFFVASLTLCAFIFTLTAPTTTYATEVFNGRSGGDCGNYLGFTSWDCGVNISQGKESLKSGIWTIGVNILADITVAAAYLVLGYVIYGGYLYTMSAGDPGKVTSGKKTLMNAFIGLAIVLLSNIILNSIRIALGGANFGNNCALNECINPADMVSSAIQWALGMIGVVSAVFVVYGGISYSSSAGDPGKVQKAKNTILYALIGLIIVALAEVITAFVTNTINSSKSSSLINDTIISKEISK